MCGIAGKFNLDGRPVDEPMLKRMVRLLFHRGPDEEGIYASGAIGLGNRRLSIIDLDTGKQPISNEDETVWVVLNGEIYNFVELRSLLKAKGHRFKTRTDTEVIVHLYEEYGAGCLERLRGMFAFALWDRKCRQLLLARDRLGEKPLFYAFVPGRSLVFASEMKSLLADKELALSLNLPAIDQYLSFLFIPAPDSIFNEVKKIPPAHYLVCTEDGVSVREYWDVPLPPEGEEDPVDRTRLRDALWEAVRLQLRSDVPVGAFLSGGIDSTTVVDAMVEHLGPGIFTCSVGFAEEGYSELSYARMVARHLGSAHQQSIVDAPAPEMVERLCRHFDEPFADSSAVPTWAVSELARRQVKVALSGDGGDELFGGYRRHAIEMWEHNIRQYGDWTSWAIARLARLSPLGFWGQQTLLRLGISPEQACALKFRFASQADEFKTEVYSAGFRDGVAKSDALEPFRRAFRRAGSADPINRILYVDLKSSLADDMLVKVDRMSMAHGLEVRAPFLDHRLVELVARLPGGAKVPGPATKPLLRSLLNGRIPHSAWDRPKHGFTAPVGKWLRDGLRSYVEETLFSPSSLAAQLFDGKGLRRLWQDHLSGRKNSEHELWMLLMLEVWHRMHRQRLTPA